MEKEINDRLLKLINENGLNVNTFSVRIGVNPAVIHNIVKGRRTKPSYAVLEKIGLSFDNIDLNWLITGQSKKYLTLEEPEEEYTINSEKKSTDTKMDELQKIVEKLASEIKALKEKID